MTTSLTAPLSGSPVVVARCTPLPFCLEARHSAAPWAFLKEEDWKQEGDPAALDDERSDEFQEGWFSCVFCGFRIAELRARCPVFGRQEHSKVNPEGVLFHFLTFNSAPGCRAIGAASSHFSWFPGCRWQVLICGRCAAHLGWEFRSAAECFSGLIRDRIRLAE